MNEIYLILPNLPMHRKERRSIIASLITGFTGLVYEGVSSFQHNKRHKAVAAMENKVNLQCNKHIHLEDSMVMYGVYDAETLEKLITTVHWMLNFTTPNKRLFASKCGFSFTWYLTKEGFNHSAINTLFYLRTLREKYVEMNEEFIIQICM